MQTLNLVNLKDSDIEYSISKFPDGQQNIVITNFLQYRLNESKKVDEAKADPVTIKSRLNNWLDLELIVCTVASLRELRVEEIHLYTPYIIGARSDRKFGEGSNNYLKDVICPIINSLGFETVTCIDPHSDVLEACIKAFKKESNLALVEFTLSHLKYLPEELENYQKMSDMYQKDGYILISPDAGASKKIYKLAEQIGYKGDIITCSKSRDVDGKITKTVVSITSEQHSMLHKGPYKDFIIIDDLCDGGATFINIAKEIKAYFHESGKTESKIYLIVTHGIFSAGFEELSKYFDGIYCTNSYQDLKDWSIDFGDISSSRQIKFVNEKIKQLNVF